VSVHRVKLAAFALSAAYAGVAGGLQAIVVGFIDPVSSASRRRCARSRSSAVVGGMGSVRLGSVIGAAGAERDPRSAAPVKEYSDSHLYADAARVPDLSAARACDGLARDCTSHAQGMRRPRAAEAPPVTDRLTVERLSVRFGGVDRACATFPLRVARRDNAGSSDRMAQGDHVD